MDDLAKKCIEHHRTAIVRHTSPVQKLFFRAQNDEDRALLLLHRSHLKSLLEHLRVEKRSKRAHAVWLGEKHLGQVTRVVKNLLRFFGFQNKDGVFIHPEEVLFLLETNRLEVTCDKQTFTSEQVYWLVLNIIDNGLFKYRVYKQLALLGYKLLRPEQYACSESKRKRDESKRKILDDQNFNVKKKLRVDGETSLKVLDKETKYIEDIWTDMRKKMPRSRDATSCVDKPDYYVYCPTNSGLTKPDFNLFLSENKLENQKLDTNSNNIYAMCSDSVSFFRLVKVQLPFI